MTSTKKMRAKKIEGSRQPPAQGRVASQADVTSGGTTIKRSPTMKTPKAGAKPEKLSAIDAAAKVLAETNEPIVPAKCLDQPHSATVITIVGTRSLSFSQI